MTLNSVRRNALIIEKTAYESVNFSEQARSVVEKILTPEVKQGAFACDQCTKSFETAWGLTVHSSKTHKKNKNKKK